MFLFMEVRVHIHFEPVLLPILFWNVSIIFYCASIWYWKEVKIKEKKHKKKLKCIKYWTYTWTTLRRTISNNSKLIFNSYSILKTQKKRECECFNRNCIYTWFNKLTRSFHRLFLLFQFLFSLNKLKSILHFITTKNRSQD